MLKIFMFLECTFNQNVYIDSEKKFPSEFPAPAEINVWIKQFHSYWKWEEQKNKMKIFYHKNQNSLKIMKLQSMRHFENGKWLRYEKSVP